LTLNSTDLKPFNNKWNEMAPIGRMGRSDELQAIAVFLARDMSSFTTESDFVIDEAFTCF